MRLGRLGHSFSRPPALTQFNHVASRAVISDILQGLLAWSLNHWEATRVEIAAEFEPAAAHEACFSILTEESALARAW